MHIGDVLQPALASLRASPPFKRISQAKLQIFLLDVVLVALEVRSGYLFDAFSLPNRSGAAGPSAALFSALTLLREVLPMFENVALVSLADDHFFVSIPSLLGRFSSLGAGDKVAPSDLDEWVTFVSLSTAGPVKSLSVPNNVKELLSTLSDDLNAHGGVRNLSLSHNAGETAFTAADLVPLAALLLEYPVAYVPDATSVDVGYLGGVDLDVYSCILIWDGGELLSPLSRHTLMQFSCPKPLTDEISNIPGRLRDRFTTRLAQAGLTCRLDILSRTERHDRVAL